MVKIRKNYAILLSFVFIVLLALSSCEKPQCKTSADCSSRTCYLSKCEDKKCVYALQRNCCGNGINESIENGKPGNQCTCPQDYGKCEGKGKIKTGSRIEDATYVQYFCNSDNQCVLGVDKKDIIPLNFLDTINTGFFKASSVVRYSKPFDISKDSFEFTIKLDDFSKDLVLPVKLTNIKLLLSSEYARAELLIADKELDNVLSEIGKSVILSVPLNLDYRPQQAEEIGSVRYIIDYSYIKRVPSGKTPDGITLYKEELVRDRFTASSKQVFFVRSG